MAKRNRRCIRYRGYVMRIPSGFKNQVVDAPDTTSPKNILRLPTRSIGKMKLDRRFFIFYHSPGEIFYM